MTSFLVVSKTVTNGNLTLSSHRPISLAAYFTGDGLLSINNDLWTGWSFLSISSAFFNSSLLLDLENLLSNSNKSQITDIKKLLKDNKIRYRKVFEKNSKIYISTLQKDAEKAISLINENIATIKEGITVNKENIEIYLRFVWAPFLFFLPV